jgi:uncharacterized protein YdeI (BOF family)
MKKLLIVLVAALLATPVIARTDGGGKGLQAQSARYSSLNQNPNSDRKCYYCWKDTSIQYTPSRHKYGKTQ